MNLERLFKTQKVLRERINYQGEDRFNKLVLALLVELGECANEWRGFKFWSKDQKPRVNELTYERHGEKPIYKNLLLEEYVDGLHFVLEIGLEHEVDKLIEGLAIEDVKESDVTEQFVSLFQADWHIYEWGNGGYYHEGLEMYLSLGKMLGFTWEQIEKAYYDKNRVNHQRQEDGY